MCRDWYNFLGIQATLPADLRDQLTQAPGTLSQVSGICMLLFHHAYHKMHADEALVLRNAEGHGACLEGGVVLAFWGLYMDTGTALSLATMAVPCYSSMWPSGSCHPQLQFDYIWLQSFPVKGCC